MENLANRETPCLVLDRAKLEQNIARMHDHLTPLGVNLRPHGKTAKNIDVMKMVLAGQDGGITVSTLKEADYYFDHGIHDLCYAVGIAPNKIQRIAGLIRRGARVSILLDSIEQARCSSAKALEYGVELPVLIEIDCDDHRSGITPDDPLLLEIGRLVHDSDGLILEGVLTHAGGSYNCKTVAEIQACAAVEREAVVRCAETLRQNGLPCPTVSVGSTPTATFTENLTGVTEVRAGVFMFQDLVMAGLGVCRPIDIALSVLASVIGHQQRKGWVIVDAGWTALSRDRGTASQKLDQGYGLVCDIHGHPSDDLIVSVTNQEHGMVSRRDGGPIDWERFPVGGLLRILPSHACATGTLHERYQVTDGGTDVVATWDRINGW